MRAVWKPAPVDQLPGWTKPLLLLRFPFLAEVSHPGYHQVDLGRCCLRSMMYVYIYNIRMYIYIRCF